jgi:para-nitrobenzyl esterase
MQDAWTSFARTGNPGCKSLGEWPPYGGDRYSMVFDKESHLELAAYEEERQIWETLNEVKYSNMP